MKMDISIFDNKKEREYFIKLVKENNINVKMFCSNYNYSFINFVGEKKELDKINNLVDNLK